MKTTCIIIDDEPNALKLIKGYISDTSSLQLQGQFFDALEALEFLKYHTVDIIFTDINMPLLSGLELADILPKDQRFIFTTAYEEYALNSFNYHVIDYLMKPFTFNRFTSAVNKIALIKEENSAPSDNNSIYVKSSGRFVKINFDEIRYVKGEKEYASLHFENERLLIYKRMKEMESLLPENFKRVHLSYIVNTDYLKKVAPKHIYAGDVKIPVSKPYRCSLQNFLNEQTL